MKKYLIAGALALAMLAGPAIAELVKPEIGDRVLVNERTKVCRSMKIFSLDPAVIKANCGQSVEANEQGTVVDITGDGLVYRIALGREGSTDSVVWIGGDVLVVIKKR